MRASALSVLCGLSCAAAVGACSRDVPAASRSTSDAAASQAEWSRRIETLERTLELERASWRTERAAAQEERERLECELAELRGRLTEREEEFLRTLQAVGMLAPSALPPGYVAAPNPDAAKDEPAVAEPEEPPELVAERARAAERQRALKSLLAVENVSGLELLELGLWMRDEPSAASPAAVPGAEVTAPRTDEASADAEPTLPTSGATGPVVFRTLDDRGRPTGSLFAERLRLEASRAARTVTIVLEDGYELHSGEKQPFERATDPNGRGGVRRIPLVHVDPAPWIAAVPELFRAQSTLELDDDGSFDPRAVRTKLNELLAEDAANGWWKLDEFAGVVDGSLRKVALRKLDRDGRLERLLFADRMRIEPHGAGVALVLEDGAQMRGEEKAPFLDGRYRIFLPRAELAQWRAAGLPGLPADAARADDAPSTGHATTDDERSPGASSPAEPVRGTVQESAGVSDGETDGER